MSETIPHSEPYIVPSSRGVVIRRRGYFYRPEWKGYTASIDEAGRYDRAAAERHAADTEGVTVHEISEFMQPAALPTPSEGGRGGWLWPFIERQRAKLETVPANKAWKNGYGEALKNVETAARALSPPPEPQEWRVPEGWKLVPRSPNDDVCWMLTDSWSGFSVNRLEAGRRLYKRVLAALPSPPEAPAEKSVIAEQREVKS